MLYGYPCEDAECILGAVSEAIGREVRPISGHGREDDLVGDLLRDALADRFGAGTPKVLMFVGMTDEEIHRAMTAFPGDGIGIERPIFCMPTEDNVTWTLVTLLDSLAAEHEELAGGG